MANSHGTVPPNNSNDVDVMHQETSSTQSNWSYDPWSARVIGGGVASTPTCNFASQLQEVRGSAASSKPNSVDGMDFYSLCSAIMKLVSLPEGNALKIEPKTGDNAILLLSKLRANYKLDLPKIFPQDGEDLVFNWDLGRVKSLFTVSPEDLDMMFVHKQSDVVCFIDVPTGVDDASQVIARELRLPEKNDTAMTFANV